MSTLPLNEPVNDPLKKVVAGFVVICWLEPTFTEVLKRPALAVMFNSSADEPETMTFLQVAIV
jgi:hypothetical protein